MSLTAFVRSGLRIALVLLGETTAGAGDASRDLPVDRRFQADICGVQRVPTIEADILVLDFLLPDVSLLFPSG